MQYDPNLVLPDGARGYDFAFKTNILMLSPEGRNNTADFYLLYSKKHPFAVTFFIHDTKWDDTSTWTVSRDVLITAAINGEPAGELDFQAEINRSFQLHNVTRPDEPIDDTMHFQFKTPDGDGGFEHWQGFTMRKVCTYFLNRTLELVPRGTEKYDIDGLISQLLAV